MKLFATTSILVVVALAALVPVAPGRDAANSQGLSPRERYELTQRYPQTRPGAVARGAGRARPISSSGTDSHPAGVVRRRRER